MADQVNGEDWLQLYETFKRYHDEAYTLITNAIKEEKVENYDEALLMYKAGLICIDEALQIELNCQGKQQQFLEKASIMNIKMANTRKDVLLRIGSSEARTTPSLSPPSYEEATSSLSTHVTAPTQFHTYKELGAALQDLSVDNEERPAEIIYTHDNVRMYFISADGTVSVPSEPRTLKIALLPDEELENGPRGYLQVGDWIYPLFPRVSPCFRTEYGAFILPDVHSSTEGSAIGLILPDGADADVHEILNNILQCIVTQPKSASQSQLRSDEGFSFTISQGLVKGAQMISRGLVKGAETASGYVNLNTPRLIHNLNPEPNPSYVSPTVSHSMQVAKDVTGAAVTATTFVANKIGWATMALGKYLAPHIQQQGTRLLTSATSLSAPEAAQTVGGALQIAAGAVEGFGTVYAGLENSAVILATCLTNNTVQIVEHKYGQPAGKVTEDTFHTVGNVITATNSARYFTPKGLVKLSAKQTGKAVVEDYRAALRETKHEN